MNAIGQVGEHAWRRFGSWLACGRCGVVRRADGKNGACRGASRVALRDSQPPYLPPVKADATDAGNLTIVDHAGE